MYFGGEQIRICTDYGKVEPELQVTNRSFEACIKQWQGGRGSKLVQDDSHCIVVRNS